jgi:hypothetical protein
LSSDPGEVADVAEFVGAGFELALESEPEDVFMDPSDEWAFPYTERCYLAAAEVRRDMSPVREIPANQIPRPSR